MFTWCCLILLWVKSGRFVLKTPSVTPKKPCVYVGMSGLTPDLQGTSKPASVAFVDGGLGRSAPFRRSFVKTWFIRLKRTNPAQSAPWSLRATTTIGDVPAGPAMLPSIIRGGEACEQNPPPQPNGDQLRTSFSSAPLLTAVHFPSESRKPRPRNRLHWTKAGRPPRGSFLTSSMAFPG
jgi:hypothetical protein